MTIHARLSTYETTDWAHMRFEITEGQRNLPLKNLLSIMPLKRDGRPVSLARFNRYLVLFVLVPKWRHVSISFSLRNLCHISSLRHFPYRFEALVLLPSCPIYAFSTSAAHHKWHGPNKYLSPKDTKRRPEEKKCYWMTLLASSVYWLYSPAVITASNLDLASLFLRQEKPP